MMTPLRAWLRRRMPAAAVSALLLASCGDSGSSPTPQPTPAQDTWYAFIVQCGNCPGLTNAEIDRSSVPYRARLRVGQLTSLRAVVRFSCEAAQVQLDIPRWIVGNPQVIEVEPSSTESAIVTALSPGISTITVERRYSDGTLSQKSLKDPANNSGCDLMPDIVLEITP
jgi:Pilus formation protein N terminal region